MPVRPLMTWIASQGQWSKMYRGQRHYISCRQLGVERTMEGSVAAANRWWKDRQLELDLAHRENQRRQQRQPRPMEDIAAASLGQPAAAFNGDLLQILHAALLREEEERRRAGLAGATASAGTDDIPIPAPSPDQYDKAAEMLRRDEVMRVLGHLLFGDPAEGVADQLAANLIPARFAQVSRAVAEIKGEASAPQNQTVRHLLDEWLSMKRRQAAIGSISDARLNTLKVITDILAAYFGAEAAVTAIDGEAIDSFYNHVLSKIAERQNGKRGDGWSPHYAKEIHGTLRTWVNWLAERGCIPLPLNANKRRSFNVTAKPIAVFTVDEIGRLLSAASPVLKLSILLALNTGATQKDVSDLLDTEVSWDAGRITRRRSKTRRAGGNVPVVSYALWPATFELLKQLRSGQDRVLLTSKGKPFVSKRLVNGKFKAVDCIADYYKRATRPLGIALPFKCLRKTAASILESHAVHGRFASLFLGHAPVSIKDRHYAAVPQELFDDAVRWLGAQLGQS